MKKLIVAISFFFVSPVLTLGATGRQVHSVETTLDNGIAIMVDERFELISTVFRLADAEEYVSNYNPSYVRQVDDYFSSFKNHELIGYIQHVRESYNFAYSIPAKAAMMVELKNGHVRINPEWALQKVFTETEEYCWNEVIFRKFVKLLDSFYRESRFHSFFISHLPFYEETTLSCKDIPSQVHMEWFRDFFGEEPVGVDMILGLCIGPNNYSIPDVCLKKDWNGRLAIVIGTLEGTNGLPFIDERKLQTVIHEIGHYYSNPLVDQHYETMKDASEFVYSKVKDQMAAIGYGNAADVTGEWINELFVNCYLSQESFIGFNVAENVEKGYLWMERAVHYMDHFYRDRDRYPTIKEFMPQLSAFVNSLPSQWPTIEKEFADRHPYVVEVYPVGGIVTPETKEVRLFFSAPMITGIMGAFPLPGYESLQWEGHNREPWSVFRWENERTFVIDLGDAIVVPGNSYGIRLPFSTFVSTRHYRMIGDYDLVLKAVE